MERLKHLGALLGEMSVTGSALVYYNLVFFRSELRAFSCGLVAVQRQWHAEKGQRDGPALSDDRPPQAVMEQHDE